MEGGVVKAIRAAPIDVGEDRRFPEDGSAAGCALWMTRLRWFVGSAIIVGALAGGALGFVGLAGPIAIIGVVVLGYNAVLSHALRAGGTRGLGRPETAALVQIAADVAALSGIIYFWGGVENPIALFYLLSMVCAGTALSLPWNYLMATLATVLFGLVGVVQAAAPELYHPMAFSLSVQYFYLWHAVVFEIAALAVALHATVYFTAVAAKRMRDTQERILHNRDLLQSIISCMSEGLVFLSTEGAVLLSNSAAAAWFPSAQTGDGGPYSEEPGLPDGLQQYMERVRKGDSPLPPQSFLMETPAGAGGQVRKFRATAASVLDQQGEHLGYVIVAEDVTKQLKLEEDLRARERQAVAMAEVLKRNPGDIAQREKMVAIGTMAAGIGHEIGNPLASLSAVIQLLKRRQRSDEDRHHLQTLEDQVDRIARIVRQMLEFSRPAVGELVLVDLNELIEQTVRMVSFSHRARHARIESVPNSRLPKVPVMPQSFQQVLVNVLLNAVDAVEGKEGEKLVTVERVFEDGWVKVLVKDRGIGMTEEQLRQVFEPFYTTKPPGRGTGLGMAVSYRLVERQGGRIEIDSTPGEGTVVTIMFRGDRTVAQTSQPATSELSGTTT
jgi:signal transduction histidine kinase